MKVYELRMPQSIDPKWWRSVNGRSHHTTVGDDGRISLSGEYLSFVGDALASGTQVIVTCHSRFICHSIVDIEAAELKRVEVIEIQKQERMVKLQTQRATDEAFNAALGVSVAWDSGYKDVLSGLSATSLGNGLKKTSVVHIRLLDVIKHGRLVRNAGDFLCTSQRGSNGKQWSTTDARSYDGLQDYPARVTCKRCIEIAERM